MKQYFKENKYVKWGLTALVVIAISLFCNHLLNKWSYAMHTINLVVNAIRPIILGMIFAYVLNPLLNIYEKYVFSKLYKGIIKRNSKVGNKLMRATSILVTFATALAIVSGLVVLILPELIENIKGLIGSWSVYRENGEAYLTGLIEDYPEIAKAVIAEFQKWSNDLITWAQNTLIPNVNILITNVSKGVYDTFRVILDVIIGMIVAVYLLAAKEKYAAGMRKYLYAIFEKDTAHKIIGLAKYTDNHFGGFLVGKIVDSAIIGVLSFIVFSIFNIPYVLLISVIIGVTNVIPFFGPFLGAIPCGVLILLVNPMKALVFAVLILAIQQLDGNVIGPKILGDKTGLDSFAVVFAILVSGGLFGVTGMIVGVPVFATVFGIVTEVCNKRLQKKNMPIEVSAYKDDAF